MLGSYYAFLDRVRESNVECSTTLLQILDKRWSTLYHPVLAFACILNPADQGRSIHGRVQNVDVQIETVIEMLVPNETERNVVFAQLMQYRVMTDVFESQSIWSVADNSIVTPTTWWRSSKRAPELTALAIRVLEIPLSSASIERVWSSSGSSTASREIGWTPNDRKNWYLYTKT